MDMNNLNQIVEDGFKDKKSKLHIGFAYMALTGVFLENEEMDEDFKLEYLQECYRIFYRNLDPDTKEWLDNLSGRIQEIVNEMGQEEEIGQCQ